LVLALIPAGTFWMGAQSTDQNGRNFDPMARPDESPVKSMSLGAFLLSKFEMTQGQWLRFAGANPSNFPPGPSADGRTRTLLNPVDLVTWNDCVEQLGRLDLVLPTEAQWEYGARAGTGTVWWTGDEKEGIAGAANLADATWWSTVGRSDWPFESWLVDGWAYTSPVGSFRPNAFGLHDVLGNVGEWWQDAYGSYDVPTRPESGERMMKGGLRTMRGGSFNGSAVDARSAQRFRSAAGSMNNTVGVRPARTIRP